MPEESVSVEEIVDGINFSELKLLRGPIPVRRIGNGNMRLRGPLYVRDPNTQNWHIRITRYAEADQELTEAQQSYLAFLLEEGLLYSEPIFEEKFTKVLDESVGRVSEAVEEIGSNFIGVVVKSCPGERRKEVISSLKYKLSEISLDGVPLHVHSEELGGKVYGEDPSGRFRIYRSSHPYNILLLSDPRGILDFEEKEACILDL